MIPKLVSEPLAYSLIIWLFISLSSCDKSQEISVSNEYPLEFRFQSTSPIGHVVVYAFDQSGLFVNSWQRKSAESFSVLLEGGNYTFVTWSNVNGTFVPAQPIKGVTRINQIDIENQTKANSFVGQPLLFGITQNIAHTGAQTLIIPISTVGEAITFEVGVISWEDVINTNIQI